MNLATRILRARKEKKLSQQGLGDLTGVSRSALAQWETQASSPSLDSLRKMAEILEVSFEWLATGQGNQHLSKKPGVLCDQEVDGEIMRELNKIDVKKKRAILNILNAMG